MVELTRRDAIVAGLALPGAAALGTGSADAAPAKAKSDWKRGFDNQRVADLGNGTYLNPLMAGDHPDPTILKDGADYYMTFSTFDSYPGLVIWHSRDLVNWQPVVAALTKNIGSVWAPDLAKHNGRYFLYIPVKASPNTSYVIWADKIEGPWSEPIDLKLPSHIDPGHAVGEDGSRW
ncbi:MAG: family 43 glycosylhydrolase, partial [Sphingomonas sp.]